MYERIFVAIDDDVERSRTIIRKAIGLAGASKARVVIGHVIDSTALETAGMYSNDFVQNAERDFRDAIEDVVSDGIASGKTGGIDVTVKCGRVRETLLDDMIEPYDPDLVICGARGLSPLRYALLGSISTFLARSARCDVLIVKDGSRQPDTKEPNGR